MNGSALTRVAVLTIGFSLVLSALTGCAPQPAPEPTPSASATTEPEPTPTETTPTERFSMPDDCTGVLPGSIVRELGKDGVTLLAGPGGKYGNELITDPTPEMTAGGISCYFGVDSEDMTLLEIRWLISVVAIDASTRDGIITDLQAQGLQQSTDELGNDTFGAVGRENGQKPATYNVVAADSWISVISATGGADALAQAVVLATDVHAANYN